MGKSSIPEAGSRKPRTLHIIFSAVAVAAIVISSIAVYDMLHPGSATQPIGTFASEPFPALWQSNFSGTPSAIETSANGVMYFLVDNSLNWADNTTWQVYAVQLSNGGIAWHHNLTFANPGNAQPQLYIHNGSLYVIGAGSTLYVNGSIAPDMNASFSIYAIPINASNGHMGIVQSISSSSNFSTSGAIAVHGSLLYAAWVEQGGTHVKVSAYSVFTNSSSPTLAWNKSLTPPGNYNTNVPYIKVNGKMLLIPLWNLVGLDPATGSQLFTIQYSALNTDEYNVMDGALVNSTLYYVAEFNGAPGHIKFNLMGTNLFSMSTTVNATVSGSTEFLDPLPVKLFGSELVVSTDLTGNYVATTLGGSILWGSQSISYTSPTGYSAISPGNPVAILSNGNWILSSVISPTSTSTLTTQYFEEIYPSNGSLVWIHQFSFLQYKGSSMFVPPGLHEPLHVLILGSTSSYLVYRWGNAVGVVNI